MHAWRIPGVPDVGLFLYKHVHSLHHKSKNPVAFSGISMHPVESALYYRCVACALLQGVLLQYGGMLLLSVLPVGMSVALICFTPSRCLPPAAPC